MPDIKYAVADVSAMKLGTVNVVKAMLGTTEIWPGVDCVTVLTEPFNNLDAWTNLTGTSISGGIVGTAMLMGNPGNADWVIPSAYESDTIYARWYWQANSINTRGIFNACSDNVGGVVNAGHVQLACTSGGQFDFRNMQSGAILAASPVGVFTGGARTYDIEVQIKLHPTAGTVKMRVDGVEVINATGLDTRNDTGTKTTFDTVRLANTTGAQLFDEMRVSTGVDCTFNVAPHPTPIYVGALAAVSSGITITPVMPTGVQADDIAIVPLMCNAQVADGVLTPPAGWTQFGTPVDNTNQSTWWYWRRLTGSDANPTFTSGTPFNTALGGYGRIYVFRGCRTTGDPFEGVTMAGAPTTSTTPTSAEITTTGPNRLAVCFVVVDDDNTWASGYPAGGWNGCGYRAASSTGGDAMFDATARPVVTAAVVPQVTVGTMSAADYWRTMTLALIPA